MEKTVTVMIVTLKKVCLNNKHMGTIMYTFIR